jgi:hypothetical protein
MVEDKFQMNNFLFGNKFKFPREYELKFEESKQS